MSPLHPLILLFGLFFQITNGLSIGSYLAAYGPTTPSAWSAALSPFSHLQFVLGISLFHLGLLANYYHDDALRLIRTRYAARSTSKEGKKGAEKHYEIPTAGLFKVVLYPHYLAEWVEWFGFWMAAGWGCVPARCFFLNEVAAMLPRAVRGKRWYVERFGADKVGRRKAVIPGVW
ncbi:3-oxo-5-alpha-steroid 4-dehydrogenase [Staphylotrichum tortipilum]|uniref:3-oxo-5-alpha-steroid 4-dehydrogenase n=1 Tax=Staphylotrichum tortipilum TaxID=2831512 RepID=A0AAN6MD53_9PEZI|nr:3-oxo-5-alpha-steroid 4-dehydrogenase [Staphylotrichum longicolle]